MEYNSWEFCKAINCDALTIHKDKGNRKFWHCNYCTAYRMHQCLQEQGYSIVKESTLREENDIQRASIQELSKQLAEAQNEKTKLRKVLELVCADLACDDYCPEGELGWLECKNCPGRHGEIYQNTDRDTNCWIRYYIQQVDKEGRK